jgi:hypothetical protein
MRTVHAWNEMMAANSSGEQNCNTRRIEKRALLFDHGEKVGSYRLSFVVSHRRVVGALLEPGEWRHKPHGQRLAPANFQSK